MKIKILAALVLLALISLGACGGDKAEKPEDTTAPAAPHTHSYTEERTAPTCAEAGKVVYTCECGHSYSENSDEEMPPHQYEMEKIAATCTQPGLTAYTCKVCGDSYSEDFVSATGHNYKESAKYAPTVKSPGYTVFTCLNCAASYNGDIVDRLWGGTAPGDHTAVPATGFDDCAFIGDSITDMLEIYNGKTGIFGNATFLAETSYSLHNCINNNYGVSYKGQRLAPEDAVAACGAKKVFIMLGTNDLVWASVDSTVQCYATLISRIKAKCPDVDIYIQSQTPIYSGKQSTTGGLSNAKITEYNTRLSELSVAAGCHFVDIATPLKDEDGGLSQSYTSDKYVHINEAACVCWQATLGKYLGIE